MSPDENRKQDGQPREQAGRAPGNCPAPGEQAETGKSGVGNLSPGGASRTGGATTGVATEGAQTDRASGLEDK